MIAVTETGTVTLGLCVSLDSPMTLDIVQSRSLHSSHPPVPRKQQGRDGMLCCREAFWTVKRLSLGIWWMELWKLDGHVIWKHLNWGSISVCEERNGQSLLRLGNYSSFLSCPESNWCGVVLTHESLSHWPLFYDADMFPVVCSDTESSWCALPNHQWRCKQYLKQCS